MSLRVIHSINNSDIFMWEREERSMYIMKKRKRGMQVVVETDGERRETDRRERKRNRVGEILREKSKMGGRKKKTVKNTTNECTPRFQLLRTFSFFTPKPQTLCKTLMIITYLEWGTLSSSVD